MSNQYTIGIDLGGTNIAGGICDANNKLTAKHSIPTEADGGVDHVVSRMALFVDELIVKADIPRNDILRIGIGAPGPLSHKDGIVVHAPNLTGWTNVPLRDLIKSKTGISASLENDANAAAYGEFVSGAGKEISNMAMFTLGTGVGGGIVIDGKLVRGVFDSAAEIGHTIIVPNGRPCPCGQKGCLERYCSANAIAERLAEAIHAGETSSLKAQIDAGNAVSSLDVLNAMDAGDALAKRIWHEACEYLAIAITNLQHLFNPELVVLAGGVINAGDKLLDPLNKYFDKQSWKIANDRPKIALATLGTDAGTIGAAALAMQND